MWRHPVLKVLACIYVAWGVWNWFVNRPFHPEDGVLASEDPQQRDVPNGPTISIKEWDLTVRADYHVTARILAMERYHVDALADLIPEDLALGWGPMSENRVVRTIDISQSNRFYYWHTTPNTPISMEAIVTHSANTHVIPADAVVERQLEQLRPGQVVSLSGELVDGKRADGRWVKTSLVRTDTGAGACEVMLVTNVEAVN